MHRECLVQAWEVGFAYVAVRVCVCVCADGFANNAHHIQPHFAGISEPLPTLIDINQLGTTRIAGTTDGTYAAASHVYAPQSANNLLAASLAARSTSNLLPINAGGMPLYQSLLNVRQQPVLLEMPGRFKALPLSVQQRIVALCQANPVISVSHTHTHTYTQARLSQSPPPQPRGAYSFRHIAPAMVVRRLCT